MICVFCTLLKDLFPFFFFFSFLHHRIPDQSMKEFSEAGFGPTHPSSKVLLSLDLFSLIMCSVKPNHTANELMAISLWFEFDKHTNRRRKNFAWIKRKPVMLSCWFEFVWEFDDQFDLLCIRGFNRGGDIGLSLRSLATWQTCPYIILSMVLTTILSFPC